MENHIQAHLLNTPLSNRVLWYDGDSAYAPADVLRLALTRTIQFVTDRDPIVDEYNKYAAPADNIRVKNTCAPLTHIWTIPVEYKNLDVVDYLFRAHAVLFEDTDPQELDARERRLIKEIILYDKFQVNDVLRTIIWIINRLTVTDTVWGVGRGSSVSSYVLYVIGVHDVDSYAYDLDIDDFLHE